MIRIIYTLPRSSIPVQLPGFGRAHGQRFIAAKLGFGGGRRSRQAKRQGLFAVDLIRSRRCCEPQQAIYDAAVTGNDLNPEQARRLMAVVGKQLRFLNRLCDRMCQLRFSVNDPLWRAAMAARDAHQDLHMAAHYASCKSGVG